MQTYFDSETGVTFVFCCGQWLDIEIHEAIYNSGYYQGFGDGICKGIKMNVVKPSKEEE